jgi:glycosyltransferase involved in cell wall biosynthesis
VQPGRRVAFVVNGDQRSAMADRARAFASRLGVHWNVEIAYRNSRRLGGVVDFRRWLSATEPDAVYVFDMALAGVVASAWYRWQRRTPLIIDTGDAITALARSIRGPAGVAATSILERFALANADHIVVRGSFHRELLAKTGIAATTIPDGVDLTLFSARGGRAARERLGLGDQLTIGLVGSCVWSPTLQIAYGWDLVELLGLLRSENVRGILIGDGSGVSRLRARARALNVEHLIVFAGRRPIGEIPDLLAACDICLSTQTNDVPGNVRTTGKLPLYLASGRYILASEVGEARYVLPAEMLVPYEGTVDRGYPARLAERVRALARDRSRLELGAGGVAIARTHFDYDMLAARVSGVLADAIRARHPGALDRSLEPGN